MGFSDSYLVKVLETARKDAEKHIPCDCKKYSNHKIIFFNWGDSRGFFFAHLLKKEVLSELKFDSYWKRKTMRMELYFV